MKTIRKKLKSISFLMSFIILFASCNQFDDEIIESEKLINPSTEITFSIEEFVTYQIELRNAIFNLIADENIKDSTSLYELQSATDFIEVKEILKNADFKESTAILHLFEEVNNVSMKFINNNSYLKEYNKEYIESLILKEFDNQFFNENDDSFFRADCNEQRHISILRCNRNFAIGIAAVTAAGFFSFGTATAIGSIAVFAIFTLCMNDVHSDYENCIS